MEIFVQFLAAWIAVLGFVVPAGLIIVGIIAFCDPHDFDQITSRKKWAWVIGVLLWPFTLFCMVIVGVFAALGYRHPKVTRFSYWLSE